MRIIQYERSLSVALRAGALVSRFLLILSLAYYLTALEFGQYGLYLAATSYLVYFLGFDFYNYTTRKIIGHSKREIEFALKGQAVFFMISYAIAIPSLVALSVLKYLPINITTLFIVILVFEHVSQELYRLLIALSEPLWASVTLFVRTGLWVAVLIPLMLWEANFRNLYIVMLFWAFGGGLSCGVAVYRVHKKKFSFTNISTNWKWIWQGIKVAIPLLVATLSIRALFTFDRFFVDSINGKDFLAVYVLFIGVSGAIASFLEAGVFVFTYPRLIELYKNDLKNEFVCAAKKMLKQTILISGVCAIFSYYILKVYLKVFDKEYFYSYINIYPWLGLAMCIYCLSMVPHYVLYAMGRDKCIVLSQILGVLVFAVSSFGYDSGVLTVPYALCISFVTVFIVKTTGCYWYDKTWTNNRC
ncbi:oligosaccharide flippase family protein [Pseudomonas sp. NPDC078700]|uniref:oligosaccharide flippase family protein n=1 Tax=Pseudomonas sp. NPDC078700 TaxID=3364424 RepID=UPI0037CA1B17